MVIYQTTNKINNKKYIGQDRYNNPNYLGSGFLLKKAIEKYGKENFYKEILEVVDTQEKLNEREIYWISFYDANKSKEYYNITIGGQGGYLGDDVNKKRSITLMGHKVSDETRLKLSLKKLGSKASEETKRKQSETHKKIDHFWLTDYKKTGADNPNSKKVKQLSTDGKLIKIWEYQKLASIELGVSEIGISSCLSGRQKTSGGYKWERYV